ncbi:MAG: TolC family protein [Desulfobacterales bacterium]|nr:TolC family protein [Desulfobacterales bacterium]
MYKKYTYILLILMITVFSSTANAETAQLLPENNTYTLDQLYDMALERSEEVGISQEQLYISQQTRKKAFSVLVPSFNAFGQHTLYSEEKYYQNTLLQPDSTSSWGITAGQSFTLNGKELIALKITEDTIEKSRQDLNAIKEEFLFGVAASYFDVLKAIKALDIADANVNRLQTQKNSISVRLSLEEVSKTDMFRVEAELSKAKAELVASKNILKFSRAVLAQLTGIEDSFTISETNTQKDPTDEMELSSLKDIAYRNRSELKALDLQQTISEDEVRFYKSDYWPTLSVEGAYVDNEQDPSSSYVNDDSLYVGLRMDLPLFDGGLRRAQIKESLSRKHQAELAYSSLKKQIDINLEQAYLAVITAKGIMDSLEDQVTFAKANYDAVSQQFNYGLANSVDITDANTLLVTAERQLSDAGYIYQLSILRLYRVQGTFLNLIGIN